MPIRDCQYSIYQVHDDGSRTEIHPHDGTQASASGWANALARERGIRTEAIDNKTGRMVGAKDERRLDRKF